MAGSSSSMKSFPLFAKDYELLEAVGEGVSATVYRARCISLSEYVAIKVIDLEKFKNDLETLRKEVHIMSLNNHPNLMTSHCSFIDQRSLWIVMPYMEGGSCFHLMKSDYPQGLEEPIIATLLREVLKALVYLHRQGHIHRDVKAGNILVHSDGIVKLGDFGVSACVFDGGDRMRAWDTFVGTPSWMAPEVMQHLNGYDFKADIWSFGITALELAHGHPPLYLYSRKDVLSMTLRNAPPRLDSDRDKKFSKSFRELIATCLVKDPSKRPTAIKLLNHSFFKHARSADYLSQKILCGLSPLGERFRQLKDEEAELLKGINDGKERLSQQEYMGEISAWNFDLEDLRKQALLLNADNKMCSSEIQELNGNSEQATQINGCTGTSPVNRESCSATKILPLLESLLVQSDIQREKVVRLIRFFDRTAETGNIISETQEGQVWEREIQSQGNFLEQSVEILVEGLKKTKEMNDQLEKCITSLTTSSNGNNIP